MRIWISPVPHGRASSVFGLTPEERLRRTLAARGFAPERITTDMEPPAGAAGRLVLLRADVLYDERLLDALLTSSGDFALVRPAPADESTELLAAALDAARAQEAAQWLEQPRAFADADVRRVSLETILPAYSRRLRKLQPAFVLDVRTPEGVRRAEHALFTASYKGITDAVTRFVWPRPALAVVRLLSRYGVAPNAVTALSWILVALAGFLFATGSYPAALAAGWMMTFLDTVDGKLARVTLRASRLGDVLDHGLDLVHPPLWYLAFGLSLAGAPASELGDGLVAVTWWIVVGYILGRGLEGIFLAIFGFELHSWRPADSAFRLITARRNPNLVLLTAGVACGRPVLGLLAVAVWTAASLLIHAVRVTQALARRRRGMNVREWQREVAERDAAISDPLGIGSAF